jgi:tight adherence protein B
MGLLLALCFALGVALIAFGLSHERVSSGRGGWRGLLASVRVRGWLPPVRVGALMFAVAVVAGGLVWSLLSVAILAVAAAVGGAYVPLAWWRRSLSRARRERERAWPAALAQLADALETGIAFPAGVALLADGGPVPLRAEFASFQARVRSSGLEAALDGLARVGERTADTVALLLRAGLLELPSGRLAPLLRELSQMLAERFEAREKARSRAASLEIEAGVLALSPIALLLLVGSASPGYLDAYRTAAGTVVAAVSGLFIFGCYLLMRRLGRVPEPPRSEGRR